MILIGNNIHICNLKIYKMLQSQPMLTEMLLKIILVELKKIEKEIYHYIQLKLIKFIKDFMLIILMDRKIVLVLQV
ncbi:331R [Invertebrate iridescent virus Kaz2018]|uniref:331R n=1 Tax=Invertebrate iridescent virus 6 TaxID=176652 RepID=Q91FJ3_IIV6|nr:331R [Invertebrate iridescent virus 6]AAK82192.1 331R [Invertebrate iridescent virus 6]QMS79523.1 hypothetical protein IIV6-T1_324 [Invertebrate iridescent virus 6]QNH08741.1 331R [Invertebrate iridescent virus Kaz2018]